MKNNEAATGAGKGRSVLLKNTKLWVLVGLLAMTVYVFATQWGAQPFALRTGGQTVAASNAPKESLAQAEMRSSSGTPRQVKEDPLKSEDPSLLPQLESKPKSFEQEHRNLFSFFTPAPPPPPPPPEPVCGDGACNGQETFTSCPGDCPPPPPPPVCGNKICEGGEVYANCPADCDPPPPPEIALRYIGYMAETEGAVAFFTDGKEVYMGRVDDIIANRYRVIRITEEGVELGYVSVKSGQSKMIPFQGNKS